MNAAPPTPPDEPDARPTSIVLTLCMRGILDLGNYVWAVASAARKSPLAAHTRAVIVSTALYVWVGVSGLKDAVVEAYRTVRLAVKRVFPVTHHSL